MGVLLTPPSFRTGFGGDDWHLKHIPLPFVQTWCQTLDADVPFLATISPQGWIQSVHKNRTRVVMHFVQRGELFLVRRFISDEADVEAVRPTLELLRKNPSIDVDWGSLREQPKWNLCAAYYLKRY